MILIKGIAGRWNA